MEIKTALNVYVIFNIINIIYWMVRNEKIKTLTEKLEHNNKVLSRNYEQERKLNDILMQEIKQLHKK